MLDLLAQYPVYIREVLDVPVEQCLLGTLDATLKDIQWVYSKDQALAQARGFLEELGAEPVAYPNTAMAAKYVADTGDRTRGAIGARENAQLYGLKVLSTHIMENTNNTTRFLVVGRQPAREGSRFSMIVTVKTKWVPWDGSLKRSPVPAWTCVPYSPVPAAPTPLSIISILNWRISGTRPRSTRCWKISNPSANGFSPWAYMTVRAQPAVRKKGDIMNNFVKDSVSQTPIVDTVFAIVNRAKEAKRLWARKR